MSEAIVSIGILALLIFSPTICSAQDGIAQKAPPSALSDAILKRLPARYRDKAKSDVRVTEETQQRWLKLSDENLAAAVMGQLAAKPEDAEFLLAELEKESSPTLRLQIIESTLTYWTAHPDAQGLVEQHAAADPDADVALRTLELLRSTRMDELGKLLEARLAAARKSDDESGLAKLASEDEHWFSLEQEAMLPEFLRKPPPVFSVVPSDKSIRVLAFGDFGTGSIAQQQTAAAMREYHKRRPFDLGITLGDNFYPYGMLSPSDPRWKTQWEGLYGSLGIKFYATLGNHDWFGYKDSPAAEILYSDKSPDWRMPSPYYSFTAGPVQFFAFDTVEDSEAELEWLDRELAKSTARWKVVYGHFPIYSAGAYYPGDAELVEKLLPILEKSHADIYLNGHDHNLQELKPEGGVHFFVSGGGGAGLYSVNPYDRSVYKQMVNGFTVLEADEKQFKVSFIGADGKVLHETTLAK